jgi:hypothetical protein
MGRVYFSSNYLAFKSISSDSNIFLKPSQSVFKWVLSYSCRNSRFSHEFIYADDNEIRSVYAALILNLPQCRRHHFSDKLKSALDTLYSHSIYKLLLQIPQTRKVAILEAYPKSIERFHGQNLPSCH